MSRTVKSQGTASGLFIVFSAVMFSLAAVFVLSAFASSDLNIFTDKEFYNQNEPITIIVEGPPFTEFYLSVYAPDKRQVFPIGDPLWKLNIHGTHNFYLEGFSETGTYTAEAMAGKVNAESVFYIIQKENNLHKPVPAFYIHSLQLPETVSENKVSALQQKKETENSESNFMARNFQRQEEIYTGSECTRTLSSSANSIKDKEGIYRSFNEVVKMSKKNEGFLQYLQIEWPFGSVSMKPYAVINGRKSEDIPSSMNFKTITEDFQGYYKWSYELDNIKELEAVGITIGSYEDLTVMGDKIIIGDIELDFSDLYDITCDEDDVCTGSGVTFKIKQVDSKTADVLIKGFSGERVLLDPTVQLQTAGTQNLADSYVRSDRATTNYGTGTSLSIRSRSGFSNRAYIKFNISSIPSSALVTDSKLCLYLYSDGATPSAAAYHVYDYTWTEGGITWNNQPCGTGFDNSGNCNLTAENSQATSGTGWKCWSVTSMVGAELSSGGSNISIALKTPEDSGNVAENLFYSKEYNTDTSLRPYLNITYETPPAITSVTNESTTNVSTLITWTTDKNANSSVIYGTDTSMSEGSNSSATLISSHSLQIGNLLPETTYYYNVTSCDSYGLCNTSGPHTFKTLETPDTQEPIAYFGENPVENYNSSVNYLEFGLKCSDNKGISVLQLWSDWSGSWSANQTNSSPVNNSVWSVLVEGIPEGTWRWGVYCNDTSGNEGWTDLNRTIIIDTKPPQITSVTNSSTTFDRTDIVWTTNEPANSSIIYGKTEIMGDGYESSTSLVYSHSLYIESLDSETLYYYNVTSCDFIGNCNTTGPHTFKTAKMPESGIPLVYLGGEPQNYFNSSSGTVEFEIKCIDDGDIDSLQLWSDWGGSWSGNETNSTPINDTWWSFSVSGIPEGTWIWGASCSDKKENTGWSALNRTLTVDLAHPEISLQNPEPFYNTTSQDVNFIFRATDNMATVLSCSLYINGSFSAVNSSVINGSLTTFEKTGLSQGLSQNWTINCTDYAGNSYQAQERHFSIDATPPIASFGNMPIDNYNYSSRSLLFELYCTDNIAPHTLELWADWSGSWSANQTNSSPVNNSVWSVLVEGIPEGTWSWGAYCDDTLSNSDWTDVNRTLTIDITKPQITDVTNESTTHTSTIISWNTDEPANSSISYGRTEDLNEGISYSSNFVFFHQVSLPSLLCDTLYYYNVTSCDFAGNCDTTGPYSFRTEPYKPLLVNTVTACAAHDSKARGTFDIACDAPDGSYLESNNGNYEEHTYTKSLYAGVRIESVDAEEIKCYGIESVYICYEWWGSNTPQDCDISVDADGGASYTVASSTCPGTIANPGPQCLDVTSLEIWTCQNFFGPTGTRAVAKSEFRRTSAGAGSTEIAYWDILYFNVSYLADIKPPEVVLNNPADNFNSSSGDIYFNCTGFDEVNLTSINLYGSWGTGWHLNATNDSVINNTLTTFNVNGIREGTYEWNCYACDNFTNCQFYLANYTITVDLTPPIITSVTNESTTNETTLITWSTDEPANSSVAYGTDNMTLSDGSNSSSAPTTAHSLQLSSLDPDTLYYYNVTSCDQVNNCATEGPYNFTTALSENDLLNINLEAPMNHSGDSDGDIIFEYNLTGNRGIINCSLILNGQLNQTNTSNLSKDTKLNFTLNGLPVAGYNWTVNCTASNDQIVGGNTSYVEVIYASDFGGSTTDLSAVDIRNIASFTIENPNYGKIVYTPNIDLSGGVNLNSVIDISYNGTYVNSSADSRLNVSATVSIYNLTYNETPVILRDEVICPGSICSVVSYNPSTGTFVFTVNHFSNYSSTENAGLAIWDETDPEGGSKTIYVGQPVMIYANYTNVTGSQPITGSGVYCNLTASGSEYQMEYNATSKLYEQSHTFYGTGNQSYNIFCNGSSIGYEPINLTDNASIEGTSLEVLLVTPPTIPGDGEANMSAGYIVGANRTFMINTTVICRDGWCGNVNATVRYNKSSAEPDTNIATTYTPGEAFFIQEGINTKNCAGNPLEEDEWCNITWVINVSADINTLWKIDVLFDSSINRTNATDSTMIQVGKILLMDLSFDVIDFGIINPDGEEFLYPAINSSNMTYNVTVDRNSNDIDELWIMGTHLTNGTVDYNRLINVSNIRWARSYLGDNPMGDPNLFTLLLSFDKVNKNGIPIYSGTNETMYFWIDAPGGILPLTYTGVLTIMGNSSF